MGILKNIKDAIPDSGVRIVDALKAMRRPSSWRYYFNARFPLASPQEVSPFFILGAGRSGNTLLRRMLCQHDSLAIPPELPMLGNVIRAYRQSAYLPWEMLVHVVIEEYQKYEKYNAKKDERDYTINRYDELKVNLEEIKYKAITLPAADQSLASILDLFYSGYMRNNSPEATRWGDKTPWNVYHFERIAKVFPHAQYIFIFRDPVDSVASYINTFEHSLERAIWRWRSANVKCLSYHKEYPSNQSILISYEDLVTHTSSTMKQLACFMDIKYDDKMLTANQVDLGDTHAEQHFRVSKPIDLSSIGKGYQALSETDINLIKKKTDRVYKSLIEHIQNEVA